MSEFADLLWQAQMGLATKYGIAVGASAKRYLVDTNNADSVDGTHGGTPEKPFDSLDYAVGRCVANRGDFLFVAPNHHETIAGANGVNFDVAGITVVALGNGTDRCTLTISGAVGNDVGVGAANINLVNLRIDCTEDAATGPLDLDAAYTSLLGMEFINTAANAVDFIVCDGNADYLLMQDCVHRGFDTAGDQSFITFTAAAANVRIKNLVSHGDFGTAVIDLGDAGCTDILLEDCILENKNSTADCCILGHADLTGWARFCHMSLADDTVVSAIKTPGGLRAYECYLTNQGGEAGLLALTPSV